ncbi:MAG TPA: hypothetical protein VHC90_09705 [Bryobacteraceae bacterium]|nr:hypothetical protein [Bryobacteraceae bacterium]
MKQAPASEIAKAITAHALGVRVDEPSGARPSTWDSWHDAELRGWRDRVNGAIQMLNVAQAECRSLVRNRDRWRLAALFGWGSVALLLLAGLR